MSHLQSEEIHQNMLSRIPAVTGREMCDWLKAVDEGPGLVRTDEKVNWLRSEHNLSHGHAKAIVHEHEMRRAARRLR